MARSTQVGMSGRVRRHITVLGGPHAGRFKSAVSKKIVSHDKLLRMLLRSGRLTQEQVEAAIRACRSDPDRYIWIEHVCDAVLDRSDDVFFVKYGRYPTEDVDFELNGHYHHICRSLEHDPHYYDQELRKLGWDDAGQPHIVMTDVPKIVEHLRCTKVRKGSIWVFGVVLVVGLASTAVVWLLLLSGSTEALPRGSAFLAVGWMLFLCWSLAVTRPRQATKYVVSSKCSECGKPVYSRRRQQRCPKCGIEFIDAGAESAPV